MLDTVLAAVRALGAGVVHRDVKPENVPADDLEELVAHVVAQARSAGEIRKSERGYARGVRANLLRDEDARDEAREGIEAKRRRVEEARLWTPARAAGPWA